MRRVTLFACALGVSCAPAAWASSGSIASSLFDLDAEGWTMFQIPTEVPATPTFANPGGNPGGHIYFRDVMDGYTFFVAPHKFLGDITGAYGQELIYDVFDAEGLNDPSDPNFDVMISGAGMTIQYDFAGAPGAAWETHIIPLIASAGWVHASTLAAASESDMLTILSDVNSIKIVGEYRSGYDLMGLDNVKLIPGPSALAILGVGMLARGRRRR